MKLATRLSLIVGGTALGILVLVTLALHTLHDSMLADRQSQILSVVRYGGKLVESFVAPEKAGSLTREEAQRRAIQALGSLRVEGDYVFARRTDGYVLVHPDARKQGKVDSGGKLPDGRTVMQAYLSALENRTEAVVDIYAKRPGQDDFIPKINGLERIPEWDWLVGYGLFVDDIDAAYQTYALRFGLIGLVVFLGVMVGTVLMARSLFRGLGGGTGIRHGGGSGHCGGGSDPATGAGEAFPQPAGFHRPDAGRAQDHHRAHPVQHGPGGPGRHRAQRPDGPDQPGLPAVFRRHCFLGGGH